MSNVKQAVAKRAKMAERAEAQRQIHFAHVPEVWIWRRSQHHGFSTVPRTLPIAMQIADVQSKGHPPGHVLFCLWARAPDHPTLTIDNPVTFAAEAGFTGARAVDTWKRRMKRLDALGFIRSRSGPAGEFHYVLLTNPNVAIERLRLNGEVQDGIYGRFWDRISEVGALGEIDTIRAHWKSEQEQAALQTVPPPPPASNQSKEDAP